MADPLSVSASIAGLIGLANEVAKILAQYISNVISAHEDAHRLHKELAALCHVLEQFRGFLRSQDALPQTHFDKTSTLLSVLGFTTSKVNGLYKKLDKLGASHGGITADLVERMKRPLHRHECEELVKELRRLVRCFQFSLNIENWLVDSI
jgi:hypothetical protein